MILDNSHFISFSKEKVTKASFIYLDIKVATNPVKRVVVRLFFDDMPKTCENFRQLCTGELKNPYAILSYKDCVFTQITTGFIALTGDIMKKNGTGQVSIYGNEFKMEPMKHHHSERGLVSMYSVNGQTIGSQFFFTFGDCSWVDGKHSVFGKIVDDQSILDDIEKLANSNGKPKQLVRIVDCGQLM